MSGNRLFSVTLNDCRVETFRAGGKGGQHQNKTETGVRITHLPSGAVGEARDTRSQLQNKREAFRRMAASPKMKAWLAREAARLSGEVDAAVDAAMSSENLKIEVQEDGAWVASL